MFIAFTNIIHRKMGKIISFEGIDGTGKSFWAEKMGNCIFDNSIFITKKTLYYSEVEYVKKIGEHMQDILWGSRDEDPIELLTNEGWLYLHLFWYTIFSKNVLEVFSKKYDYIFLDGWFYKILARYMEKKKFDIKVLEQLFEHLVVPDLIVYLDIKPDVCYKRKKVFNKCELGGMDGIQGEQKECFVNYQSLIRQNYLYLLDSINDRHKIIVNEDQINELMMRDIIINKLSKGM